MSCRQVRVFVTSIFHSTLYRLRGLNNVYKDVIFGKRHKYKLFYNLVCCSNNEIYQIFHRNRDIFHVLDK